MCEIRWKQRLENFKLANENILETANCIKKEGLNNIYTMALIQAFEMSFELAWKTIKDYLEYNGKNVVNPRSAIKEAFAEQIITDGQHWIEMMEARNKTSHTYKKDFAKQTANEILDIYVPLLVDLEKVLKAKENE